MSSSDDEPDLTQSDPAETMDGGDEKPDLEDVGLDRDMVSDDTVLSDPSDSTPDTAQQLHTGIESSRFRVIRTYAKGGLGRVVLARDIGLSRNVAIKDINPKRDSDQARMRLVREATVTGGLEHPNIIPVYDIGYYDDGSPYYMMRFVQGHTLRDAILEFHAKEAEQNRTAHRLEMRRLLRHLIEVCNAVGYAHSQGILHRDIKPANIMIGKHDETLVLDWGLTKTLEEFRESPETVAVSGDDSGELDSQTGGSWESGQTQMGSVLGTPGFMSPEQAAGKVAEMVNATDVYGLGATMYYLLCGKRPIVEKSRARLIERTIAGEIRTASSNQTQHPQAAQCNLPQGNGD